MALQILVVCVFAYLLSINSAYYLSLNALEWQNASNFCYSFCGSQLASVHSTRDHLTTLDIADRNPAVYTRVWTGLNDIAVSDVWEWSDGSLFDFGNIKDSRTGLLVRGTYPWRSDEPDIADADSCVALEVGSLFSGSNSREWVDRKETANYHFFCNGCSSVISKYAVVNGARNYTEAESVCGERFGTSLASIHSDSDMIEARTTCKQITTSNGCWLGLNDRSERRIYRWTDGTPLDYGQIFHVYPWYSSEPGPTLDQQCIFLDPSNGADLGEYLWDDYWCYSAKPRALCNAPSEICYPQQFFIPRGTPTDWEWSTKPCTVTKTGLAEESVALIGNKQYVNTAGTLVVDMMYAINSVNEHGNAGIAFYMDESNCNNYYYVGIWAESSLLFIGAVINGDWNLITFNLINPAYILTHQYVLRIELSGGTAWNVMLNGVLVTSAVSDEFSNAGNQLSGYIAIRSRDSSITVKHLFVSGEAQYFDSNSWYLSCTESPTAAPTHPTISPTSDPTLEPTTGRPSIAPTLKPTISPSQPTRTPTTAHPSTPPTTSSPTASPTNKPSAEPTLEPTYNPSFAPTVYPTNSPSLDTLAPTVYPTNKPTKVPTLSPSNDPTIDPTNKPTYNPSIDPTIHPSIYPSIQPTTQNPTKKPTNLPSQTPSFKPSAAPTVYIINTKSNLIMDEKTQNNLIWVIGVPIALMFTCFFGIYLLYRYWIETKEKDNKKRKKSSHIRSPSNSINNDDHHETKAIDIDEEYGIDDESGALMDPQCTDNKGELEEKHNADYDDEPKSPINYRLQQSYRSNV